MDEETIFSHWKIYNISRYNIGCPFNTLYTYIHRMSVAIVSIPLLEIGDFDLRIKQKTLS